MVSAGRLAVLGVDGGSWNVLGRLIRDGYMPNLGRMVKRGVHGNLRSIIPPVTGGAWLALATGLNPGKTGVLDFLKLDSDMALHVVSSKDFRGRSLWDYLSLLDYRVAVLDYPMLYPAYPVNGIMLCSWGGRFSTYPESLAGVIRDMVDNYDVFVEWHVERFDDIELFLDDLDKAVEKKLKVSRRFAKAGWDLFVDVLSFTDWLQHRMWHFFDSSHPLYRGGVEASRYRRRFTEYWQLVDEYIGEVSEIYDNVLVVSDHGFGSHWGVFNFGRWLLKHGFVEVRGSGRVAKRLVASFLRRLGFTKFIPQKLRKRARKLGVSAVNIYSDLDMDRSKIIVLESSNVFGALRVNPKIDINAEELLHQLEQKLQELGSEVGQEIKVQVWRVKDLYWGDKVNLLPDLIVAVNDWSSVIVYDPTKDFIYSNGLSSPRHTGSHRLEGVFVAYGVDIRNGVEVQGVSVLDVAPTILYMFDAPIPNNIDGRVLEQIFEPSTKLGKKLIYVEPSFYVKLKISGKVRKIKNKLI
jgi:predicted AlkP superfamily phosphohydrolase/phosphomutase